MDIIIGLIGAKGAGKTTAFEAMAEVTEVTEITLADKLKNVCSEVFEIPRDAFDNHAVKEKLMDPPIFFTAEMVASCYNAFNINPLQGEEGRIVDHARFHVGQVFHTPRQIAQYVGTEVLRTLEPDVHCINAIKGKEGRIGVVTDIRFPNELAFFEENCPNFIPVYLKNTGAEVKASGDSHASEAHLQTLARKSQIMLENEGPIHRFREQVRGFINKVVRENV